ncbi:hypothetical protein [Arthrobacter sp. G119Y2]|uniref:hypothetical protein n=1 Tax=Arthrobacter sp. G119Y2 TaxID=3134965 RepID=UPI00311A8C34
MSDKTTGLARLREPFAAHQISKLPKPYRKDSDRGQCRECGGYHGLPAMHLDYVGHAALTDRLLEVDPEWTWEPVAFGQDGLPKLDGMGGLWIKLTVCGVTRLGYGDAQGKTGPNAIKEAIGDGLRNAGMRFGAALDLWHKGDLHAAEEEQGKFERPDTAARPAPPAVNWQQELVKARNNRELLLSLRQRAIGMEAPQAVIDEIDRAGKALSERTAA